jgi:hypothetical protein
VNVNLKIEAIDSYDFSDCGKPMVDGDFLVLKLRRNSILNTKWTYLDDFGDLLTIDSSYITVTDLDGVKNSLQVTSHDHDGYRFTDDTKLLRIESEDNGKL